MTTETLRASPPPPPLGPPLPAGVVDELGLECDAIHTRFEQLQLMSEAEQAAAAAAAAAAKKKNEKSSWMVRRGGVGRWRGGVGRKMYSGGCRCLGAGRGMQLSRGSSAHSTQLLPGSLGGRSQHTSR